MNKIHYSLITASVMAVAIAACILVYTKVVEPTAPTAGNAVTQGINPAVASSSALAVTSGSVSTLAASSTACTSRIISTASTSAMLSFGGKFTPTAAKGHWQPASTTKEYENAVYGCGQIDSFSFGSGLVTVTVLEQH